ncbi:MAG TPA: Ku protein [Candidatus Binataceae bacterium]|nr:Ku protein [Candidatus Binataceae bacterium]
MAARPIAAGSISFGLVSIPVKLYTATRPKSVSFNLLHAKDKSRIQQKIYCPADDAIIDRSELVRGYQIEKGVYVTFTDEELEKLEAHEDHAVAISEFVPLEQVDPVYFENSYHLGCSPESARAYKLLATAMTESKRVALAHFTMRNKEHLVIIRPYEGGLMLHTMYYADEVVAEADVDRGQNAKTSDKELELAQRLIDDLTEKKFDPSKYHDEFRERVQEAAQRKAAGEEAVTATPTEPRGKVIDLMSALKASLEKRGSAEKAEKTEEAEATAEEEPKQAAAASSRSGGRSSEASHTRSHTKTRKRK